MTKFSVNRYIDAVILKPELPEADVVKGLEQYVALRDQKCLRATI